MMIAGLYLSNTDMGRGVFTSENIEKGALVESAPVIVMNAEERVLLDKTRLHDYIFEWVQGRCCMALGWVPMYNHSFRANCEYEMDFENAMIHIRSVHFIKAGEELFINYNGDWNNEKPLWFQAK
jgi:uncharacterized protein